METEPQPVVQPASNTPRLFLFLTAAALIIGALLPWGVVSLGMLSRSIAGYEGDGIGSGIAGLIVLIFAAIYKPDNRKGLAFITFLLSLFALYLSIPKITSLGALDNTTIGVGLIVTILGGIIGIIAAGLAVKD